LVIAETAYQIATVVLAVCASIDILRQCITCFYLSRTTSQPFTEVLKMNASLRKSIHLGIKFYFGVVGWTAGYVMIAQDHQLYTRKDFNHVFYHAVGASIGSSIGLFLSCELVGFFEKYIIRNQDEAYQQINHRGAIGVAIKGILEAALWSIIGDLSFYKRLDLLDSQNVDKIVDSLIVGVPSSIGFSIMGIFTSIIGYYQIQLFRDAKQNTNYHYHYHQHRNPNENISK
jgi:hypothetical protein